MMEPTTIIGALVGALLNKVCVCDIALGDNTPPGQKGPQRGELL